jgi:hypothetical protein
LHHIIIFGHKYFFTDAGFFCAVGFTAFDYIVPKKGIRVALVDEKTGQRLELFQ